MHVRSLDVTEAVESNLIKVARIKLHATLLTLNHGVWSMADSTAGSTASWVEAQARSLCSFL